MHSSNIQAANGKLHGGHTEPAAPRSPAHATRHMAQPSIVTVQLNGQLIVVLNTAVTGDGEGRCCASHRLPAERPGYHTAAQQRPPDMASNSCTLGRGGLLTWYQLVPGHAR
jgi:hypothetical protein